MFAIVDGPRFNKYKHRTVASGTIATAACVCGMIIWSIVTAQMNFAQFLAIMALTVTAGLYLGWWIVLEHRILRRSLVDYDGVIIERNAPYTRQTVQTSRPLQTMLDAGKGLLVVRMGDGEVMTLAVSPPVFAAFADSDHFQSLTAYYANAASKGAKLSKGHNQYLLATSTVR